MTQSHGAPQEEVLLRLFVTGTSQRSSRAIDAVRVMCRDFLTAGVRVEIIDVIREADKAEAEKVLATPTLIRQIPGPPRRLVGDLGEISRVIELLGLQDHLRRKDDEK